MSFKIGRFFYLTISFILGAFLLVVGFINLLLPWSFYLKDEIVRFVWEDNIFLPLFGLALILIGLSLLVYTIWNSKHRYLQIKTGPHSITLDENIIQNYLEAYWQELFPKHPVTSRFKIKKNSIQIVADLPSFPLSEQQKLIEKIGYDFSDIFGRLLGYGHEIDLIVNFR